jgi:MFS family permease
MLHSIKHFKSHLESAFTGIPRKIWMLSIVSLINRSGAMVICFLTLYLTEKLHFTIQEAGYAMSCFGVGAIIGAYAGGKWTDKFGYKNVMLSTLTGTGFFLLILMFVRDFWTMCATLMLLNVISEAFRPASSASIRTNSDDAIRTRAFSLFRVFINLAVTFALVVGGFLIGLGWDWIFICDAITCFGAAFILSRIDLTEEKKIVKNEVKDIDNQLIESKSALKDKEFMIFVFLTFLGAIIFMQIVWTVPAYFKQIFFWSEAKIGTVSALNGLVVMLVELPLIFQIEGKRTTTWFIRLGIMLYGLSYLTLVLPVSLSLFAAVFYMIFISFGEIFVMPFSSTWVTQRATTGRVGQYLALYTMAYSVSNVVAPWLGTQIIAHFGFDALWLTMSVLSVITFVGFWQLGANKHTNIS